MYYDQQCQKLFRSKKTTPLIKPLSTPLLDLSFRIFLKMASSVILEKLNSQSIGSRYSEKCVEPGGKLFDKFGSTSAKYLFSRSAINFSSWIVLSKSSLMALMVVVLEQRPLPPMTSSVIFHISFRIVLI